MFKFLKIEPALLSALWESNNSSCVFCSPVNLAAIKYLCFLVELLTPPSPAGLFLAVYDDIQHAAHVQSCPSFCLCYLTFPPSSLLCQRFECPLASP